MKISNSIYLSLILSTSLISSVDAAKENFDRSKPHVRTANGLNNVCNDKKDTKVCTPQQLAGNPRCNPSATSKFNDPTPIYMTIKDKSTQSSTCVKPKMQAPATLASSSIGPQSSLQSGGTKATDYNSSRSNKSYGASVMDYNSSHSNKQGVYQDGDDLFLRKRPGRTALTPSGRCSTPKFGKKSQTKVNCPAKK